MLFSASRVNETRQILGRDQKPPCCGEGRIDLANLLGMQEFADVVGVVKTTVWTWIESGKLIPADYKWKFNGWNPLMSSNQAEAIKRMREVSRRWPKGRKVDHP